MWPLPGRVARRTRRLARVSWEAVGRPLPLCSAPPLLCAVSVLTDHCMSAPKRASAARAADELNRYRWRIVHEVRHIFQRAAEANWEDAGATQFYERWQTLLRNDSLPHQAVYIPLPWRLVLEKEVRGDGVLDGFVWLLDWWRTLQFGRYRHFVTLLQCSTSQMKRAALQLNRTFSFPDDVRSSAIAQSNC